MEAMSVCSPIRAASQLPAVRSLHGDALGQSLRSSNSVCLPIPKALSAGQILPGGSAPQKLQIQAKILKTKRAPRDPDYPWPDKYNAEEKGFLAFLSKFKDVAKPAKPMALPFEKPLVDLEKKIDEVRQLADKTGMDFTDQVQELQDKYEQLKRDIYARITPVQRLSVARHPNRPTFLDHVLNMTDKWVELHGDRGGYDDPALVCGIGRMDGMSFMFMGHQKGRNTKENIYRNFGMPTPNGYRKALRMMRHADHHGLPIITFVDTPGAYAGVSAEELGQGEAIAHNLREMFGLKVPSVSVVIGEGGSGGALAIGCCNKMLMLENAVYFVASPEACAAILWKTAAAAPKATEALRITADQLQQLGVVDEIIPEPLGGAHNDHMATSMAIKSAVMAHMKDLVAKDEQRIICERVGKFRQMGGFTVPPKVDPAKQRALKKRDRPAGQSVPASPSPSRSASLPSWGSQPPAAPADNGNGATYPSSVRQASSRSSPRLFFAGFLASQSPNGSFTDADDDDFVHYDVRDRFPGSSGALNEMSLNAFVVPSFEEVKAQGENGEWEHPTWRFLAGGGCGTALAVDGELKPWVTEERGKKQASCEETGKDQGKEQCEHGSKQQKSEQQRETENQEREQHEREQKSGAEQKKRSSDSERRVNEAEERFFGQEQEGQEREGELTGAAGHRTRLCAVRWDRQPANECVTGGECSQDAGVFVSASGRLMQWDVAPAAPAQQHGHAANNTSAAPQHSPTAQPSTSSTHPTSAHACLPLLPSLPHWVTITSVSVGLQHCLALSGSGMVWAWGEGGEGQLGVGRRVGKVTQPVCVMLPAAPAASVISTSAVADCAAGDDSIKATAVACGGRHSLVLAKDGSLFSFGWGQYGQCGHGTSDDHLSPTRLTSFAGLAVTAIAADLWHSLALALPAGSISNRGAATGCGAGGDADVEVGSVDVELEGGDVYSWGGNQFGQLGTGDTAAKV
ncbi:unnamed protein product [Closterium sp. Naga37s-1]|nr:unnamed protein product [Closterium sp. Naga37s-1]